MLRIATCEELGNNRYQINGEDVYAPNMATAKKRYQKKHDRTEKEPNASGRRLEERQGEAKV